MEGVCNYGITCHCYRFQGTFDSVNGLAVSYTNMKDMVYSLALKLPFNPVSYYVPAEVPALQPGQVIRIIGVIWITFCPGQSGFHLDMLNMPDPDQNYLSCASKNN